MGLLLKKLLLWWIALQAALRPEPAAPPPPVITFPPPTPPPPTATTTTRPPPVKKIVWEPLVSFDPALMLVSGGFQNGREVFLARTLHGGHHVPGRIPIFSSEIIYAAEGEEQSTSFGIQVLRAPEGSFTWMPMNQQSPLLDYSSSMIKGGKARLSGKDPESWEIVGCCRVKVPARTNEFDFIPGFFSPSNRTCSVGFRGRQMDFFEFEVLLVSGFGMATHVGQGSE